MTRSEANVARCPKCGQWMWSPRGCPLTTHPYDRAEAIGLEANQ